ncbi:MAG: hypothetical protein CMB78_00845 [Euryarchaeota archaeon]|nr:hypothetical protein [Euryarchaeota archaeon]|tara:strand:+ start:316 stop:1053 length:738 start_codon:yes stop_codon:yes gene_type:complete
MKHIIKRFVKKLKTNKGSSLAEFATTTALMATLAATAAPKLSEMAENSKREKTMNEIGKMLAQAQQFYQDAADSEGRGRFPGQGRYDMCVGGENHGVRDIDESTHELERADAELDLFGIYDAPNDEWSGGQFTNFEDLNAQGWLSVFGLSSETRRPDNHNLHADDTADIPSNEPTECKNCQGTEYSGHEEWLNTFGDETIDSPFQDGHYIYRVVPGYGSGSNSVPPTLYIADLENPADFSAVLTP